MSTPSDPRPGGTSEPQHTFSLYAEREESPARGFNSLVTRPPETWAGAVFLTLAGLPLVVTGVALALMLGSFGDNLQDKINGATDLSIGASTLLVLLRVGGVVILAVGAALILMAWRAWRPNAKARMIAAVLAALEVLAMVVVVLAAGVDPVSIGLALLAAAGTILLYLPRSDEFVRASR